MKKNTKSLKAIFTLVTIAIVLSFNSCRKDDDVASTATVPNDQATNKLEARNSNCFVSCIPDVYPVTSRPYGKYYYQWGENFFKWLYAIDCSHSPYYDLNGNDQNQNQSGPVYFLGGSPLGQVITRNVTIPAGKALFIPIIYYFANTGCGELESSLKSDVSGFVPLMDQLSVTIDGNSLVNVGDFHSISCKFSFTGNSCFNTPNCIDGTLQKAVIGGYWIIVKPLCPGTHTIHTQGGASTVFPPIKDVTWNITQL